MIYAIDPVRHNYRQTVKEIVCDRIQEIKKHQVPNEAARKTFDNLIAYAMRNESVF